MGKSKFPGKPSKLVNKKRVSVLNSVANNPFCDNSTEDDGDQVSSSESETTKTFDGHGTQVIIILKNLVVQNCKVFYAFSGQSFNNLANNSTIFGCLVIIYWQFSEHLATFHFIKQFFVCLFGEIHLSKFPKRIFIGTYKHHTDSV